MDVLYQNLGYLADGALSSNCLHYSAKLQEGLGKLPKFSEIIISKNTTAPEKTLTQFQDQYPENRVKSLVHYWLFLIETRPKNPADFKELLTDQLDLALSSRHITNSEALEMWIKEADSQILRSGHHIVRFDWLTIGKDEYEIEMEFKWRGFMHAQPNIEYEAHSCITGSLLIIPVSALRELKR